MKIITKKYSFSLFYSNHKKAFTLVELIIVITILAILATIAVVSFQGYTKDSRDGNRLATITNIQKGLDMYQIKTGSYPFPDGKISTGILDGTLLAFDGVIGENISRVVNLNTTPTDPLGLSHYVYGVSVNLQKYQVATSLENLQATTIIPTTYANNYVAKVTGNYVYPLKLGNMLYTIPSLIFTGTGELRDSSTFFVIDKGQNLPYQPNVSMVENKQNTQAVLEKITGTGGLTLTSVTIPITLNSTDFKNLTQQDPLIQELFIKIGITNKDQLWQIIYGNNLGGGIDTSTSSSPGLSCGVDLYEVSGVCQSVGNGYYSANGENSRSQCTTKPTQNSQYTSSGNGTDNCSWTCTGGFSGGNCDIPPDTTYTLSNCSGTYTPSNRLTQATKAQILSNITDYIGCEVSGKIGKIAGYTYSGSYVSDNKMILLSEITDTALGTTTWAASAGDIGTLSNINVGTNTTSMTQNVVAWDGLDSTQKIIGVQGVGSTYAAQKCNAKTEGSQTWYLPSTEELNQLYCYANTANTGQSSYGAGSTHADCVNKGYLSSRINSIPNFTAWYYWSSTEYDSVVAWSQNFGNGYRGNTNSKSSNPFYIRCVARF